MSNQEGGTEVVYAESNILDANYYIHITVLNIINSLRENNYDAFFLNVNLLESILLARGIIDDKTVEEMEKEIQEKLNNMKSVDKKMRLFTYYLEKFKYLLRHALEPSAIEDVVEL